MSWDTLNPNTQSGQFLAVLLIYSLVVGLRCAGFEFMKEDHTLIMGALLTLLRSHAQPEPK